jgi:ParB-like nuclease domain
MKTFKQYLSEEQDTQNTQQPSPTQFIIYPNFQGCDTAKSVSGQKSVIAVKDTLGNEPGKDYNYFKVEKKDYVENMIRDAQGERWKSFEPIVAIKHPVLQGKYLAIDGNHRLGAFKIGGIPQINAIIVGYENILLATPDTKWSAGVVPKTIFLNDVLRDRSIDLKLYFNTKELQIPQQQIPQQQQ